MTAISANHNDREQQRESLNTLRILGGLCLLAALLLYFFHLAEAPMGQHWLGIFAGAFAVAGIVMLWVGGRRIRALR